MGKYEALGRKSCKTAPGQGQIGVRTSVACALILLLWFFFMPLVFLSGGQAAHMREPEPEASSAPAQTVQPGPLLPAAVGDGALTVRVRMPDGAVEALGMADYLWRVVSAEMPAAFDSEALKAQTVAARTYAVRKMEVGESKHPEADVCTDIGCCQAYITPEQAYENWGNSAAFYHNKIANAVIGTDGLVVTYGGTPIDAVFHSSSAGRTADAVEVWGSAVPYLVGVDSPEGEEVPNYDTSETFEPEEFAKLFLEQYPGANLSGDPSGWFKNPTYSASGAVATIEVGGVSVKGTVLRTLCALRSAHFTVQADKSGIRFAVTAYGHGVGLSQYGANALAKQGKGYEEILKWYYTGVDVTPYLPTH